MKVSDWIGLMLNKDAHTHSLRGEKEPKISEYECQQGHGNPWADVWVNAETAPEQPLKKTTRYSGTVTG